MTPAEFVQMKAFARIDGALLSLLWIAAFACYVMGIATPYYGAFALLLMLITPFFVGKRLARFRDAVREGIISMRRGWAYTVFVFFYAAVLLALAQYVYFQYMDQGFMMSSFNKTLSTPEAKQMIEQMGMQQTMEESLQMMGQMRPIDYALNVLTVNIVIGILLGFPIGALMQRKEAEKS